VPALAYVLRGDPRLSLGKCNTPSIRYHWPTPTAVASGPSRQPVATRLRDLALMIQGDGER